MINVYVGKCGFYSYLIKGSRRKKTHNITWARLIFIHRKFHKCLIISLPWGCIGWSGSNVLRKTKWASKERRYYLICTHVTFSNILCGCCWAPICQISTERTKTRDSGNSGNILLLAGTRNQIRWSHFLPVIYYWYMFYLAISHFIQNAFNRFTVIFLNYLVPLNFFSITNIYLKYI